MSKLPGYMPTEKNWLFWLQRLWHWAKSLDSTVSELPADSGNSVFITYHDNAPDSEPDKPEGNGNTGGWHTDPTSASVWMSTMVAETVTAGNWSDPILMKGQEGATGPPGATGVPGETGVSFVGKGDYASHEAAIAACGEFQNGWWYRNTTNGISYSWSDDAWYVLTEDGLVGPSGPTGATGASGATGAAGADIVWQGESASPPADPQVNWCYRDTDDGKVYIYTGEAWDVMTQDGDDGEDGAVGDDGNTLFVTYCDYPPESAPPTPTGNGAVFPWHTYPTGSEVWVSQKYAAAADEGEWGTPFCQWPDRDGDDTLVETPEKYYLLVGETAPYTPHDNTWHWEEGDLRITRGSNYDVSSLLDPAIGNGSDQDGWERAAYYINKALGANPVQCRFNGVKFEFYSTVGAVTQVTKTPAGDQEWADYMKFYPPNYTPVQTTKYWVTHRTYHTNAWSNPPSRPTGSGDSGGWSPTDTEDAKWVSTKLAESISEGLWGHPVPIAGAESGSAPELRYTLSGHDDTTGYGLPVGKTGWFRINIDGTLYTCSGFAAGSSYADYVEKINEEMGNDSIPAYLEYVGSRYVFYAESPIYYVEFDQSPGDPLFDVGGVNYLNFEYEEAYGGLDKGGLAGMGWLHHWYCYSDEPWSSPPDQPAVDVSGDEDWYLPGDYSSARWRCHKLSSAADVGEWDNMEGINGGP